MPKYELRRQDGVQTSRLTRNPPSDDPTALVGSLAIEVEALPGDAEAAGARMMPHDVVLLRLGYHIPFSATEAEAPAPEGAAAFAGRWRNLDPDAHGCVALEIEALSFERLGMRGKMTVPAYDDGTCRTEGFFRDGEAMGTFHLPDRFLTLHLRVDGAHLRVVQHMDVLDGGDRDGIAGFAFRRDTGVDEGPLIWVDLEPPVATGPAAWRSVTPIVDDETYLRLFKVMTSGEHEARLEATFAATVGQRSWRQIFVGERMQDKVLEQADRRVFFMDKQQALQVRQNAGETMKLRPEIRFDPRARFEVINPSIRRLDRQPREAFRRDAAVETNPDFRRGVGRLDAMRPISDIKVAPRADLRMDLRPDIAVAPQPDLQVEPQPDLQVEPRRDLRFLRPDPVAEAPEALKLQMMDVIRDQEAGARPPRIIICDPTGIPVLTRRREESIQYLAPFWFDPKAQKQMFDAPDDSSGRLVLLRHEVRAGERTATFYQDGLEPRQVYYEPEEFRLARADAAPFAPLMLFHMSEEVDADAQDADGLAFSVTLTYRARPFLHPALLQAARERFGRDAVIAPITPVVSKLKIGIPGEPAALERSGVDIDFADGLSDILTFSEAEYRRLTTALQTVSGVGLEGEVEATLLDGRTARIPVRIGLRDTVGTVFDWALTEGAGGRFSVALRNRIESPVRLDELPVVALGEGASARPEAVPPADPIAPRDMVSLDYRITPTGAGVSGFDPTPVASVLPDFLTILAQTTVVQGYADDSFDVELAVDPLYFEAAGLARPLTGVRVEFSTREAPVVLTMAQPRTTVTLQMPLLLYVTNAAAAQHYSYSVTNLHADGDGTATAFMPGSGDLEVTPAPFDAEAR